MARALILQTQADAPAGLLEGWARRRGIELACVRADRDALPDAQDYDAVIALGSGATATGAGPEWVAREIEWLRAADVPVLGICFGAQALAAALGGGVHRLPKPEIGWVTVDAQRLPRGPWMAWHEDGFALPPRAEQLASNAFGVQAFGCGASLGVQFHPEVTPAIVADWVENDHGDLARAGVDGRSLLPAPPTAARAAELLFDGFAARAGLAALAAPSARTTHSGGPRPPLPGGGRRTRTTGMRAASAAGSDDRCIHRVMRRTDGRNH